MYLTGERQFTQILLLHQYLLLFKYKPICGQKQCLESFPCSALFKKVDLCVKPASEEHCNTIWVSVLDGFRSRAAVREFRLLLIVKVPGDSYGSFSIVKLNLQGWCFGLLLLGLGFFLNFEMNVWKWMYHYQENKGFFSLSTDMFSEVN